MFRGTINTKFSTSFINEDGYTSLSSSGKNQTLGLAFNLRNRVPNLSNSKAGVTTPITMVLHQIIIAEREHQTLEASSIFMLVGFRSFISTGMVNS